jgi:hypothetical protein
MRRSILSLWNHRQGDWEPAIAAGPASNDVYALVRASGVHDLPAHRHHLPALAGREKKLGPRSIAVPMRRGAGGIWFNRSR